MVKLPLPGRTYQKRPCKRVAVLVCVLSVFFIVIPVHYGEIERPAPQCATLFAYDKAHNVFASISVAIIPGERDHPVKTNHHFFNHREDRFPQHHNNNNMVEMMMAWFLQPLLFILRNLKLLYVFLLILLLFYIAYFYVHRGIQLLKEKYGK